MTEGDGHEAENERLRVNLGPSRWGSNSDPIGDCQHGDEGSNSVIGANWDHLDPIGQYLAGAQAQCVVSTHGSYFSGGPFLARVSALMKNRLKTLRAERNLTQAELAKLVAVSRQTVNAIEKGKFAPSLPLAFRIARLFRLSIEEVFLDELAESESLRQNVLEPGQN